MADPHAVTGGSRSPRITAVVFDIDGTLVDHAGSAAAALDAWLPELGAESSPELIDAWLAAEEVHIRDWRSGRISWQEQRRRRLRDFLPVIGRAAGPAGDLDLVFAGYLRHYERSWRAFADALPAVAALGGRGLRLAVLSNGARDQQAAKLAAVGLDGIVGPVLTADDLGSAKPDPVAYRSVCERLGLPPAEILHVGDLVDLDVEAPRAAGLLAVQVDRARPSSWPDRVASLAELPGLIERLER